MEILNADADPLKREAALDFLRDLISLIEGGRYDVTEYPSISFDAVVTYTFRFRDRTPQED
jgi:hypothetical protein